MSSSVGRADARTVRMECVPGITATSTAVVTSLAADNSTVLAAYTATAVSISASITRNRNITILIRQKNQNANLSKQRECIFVATMESSLT